jgi:hypothetical protein
MKFSNFLLSRTVTVILIVFLFLSQPRSFKTYIDSYEDRSGSHDIYETTYPDKPNYFELVVGEENKALWYFIFNLAITVFLAIILFRVNYFVKPAFNKPKIDFISIISAIGMITYNPIDPIIKYLPPWWKEAFNLFYIGAFVSWLIAAGTLKAREKKFIDSSEERWQESKKKLLDKIEKGMK